jgi:hypothetical protein
MTAKPVEELIAPVCSALQVDGADLRFEYERSGTVYFRLILTDETACRECVMPQEILEQVVLTNLRRARSDVTAVEIDDPRSADAAGSSYEEPPL